MERRDFIRKCCYASAGILTIGMISCDSIYYAVSTKQKEVIIVSKKEFIKLKNEKETKRKFVLLKDSDIQFPICLYKTSDDEFSASLLKCTHNGCELNVGGGIYSCPCHGAEFTVTGEVLQGPAETNLKTFKTETDNENIYVYLS